MATTFTSDTFLELIASTTKKFERGKWSDLAKQFRNHYAMDLMREQKTMATGQSIQFNAKYRRGNQAQNVLLNQPLNYTIQDFGTQGTVPWRHSNSYWTVVEQAEAMNSGPERLYDMVKMARVDAFSRMADLLESNWWTAPSSSSNEIQPYGMPYWIVKTAASSTGGFNGTVPSGHTSVGGITDQANWRNWNALYTDVSKDDAVQLMREAVTMTSFTPPIPYPSSDGAAPGKKRNQYRIYTTYSVIKTLESILENQNENLGKDLAPMDGMVMFRGVPVLYVDYLSQNDSTNPIYGINFDCWQTVFLKGFYMKEQEAFRLQNQPMTIVTNLWNSMNYVCNNRREGGWVLSTS